MREADRATIFDCAISIVTIACEQCDAFVEMCDYLDERATIARRISSYEANADEEYSNLGFYFLENKLMGDPDAVNLFNIVTSLEAITDSFEELANSLVRYNINESGKSLCDCAAALYGASQKMHDLILAIRDKAPVSLIIRDITALDKYKSRYCKFYDEAILELFTDYDKDDAIDIIRSKAVYDAFKDVFESFEKLSERCYRYIMSLD
ncbi:hypothetical protein SAMN02910456_01107 [Ruminococcaceae bacterium YRB3002]|nr:hypothetical protein SAMN02910456_01107 [Ruminococcaceae bacterium YRB3002]